MSEAPDHYLTTKPVTKQLTMEDVFSKSKKQQVSAEKWDIVPNPNKKKPERKKTNKKMSLDSDEQEDDD